MKKFLFIFLIIFSLVCYEVVADPFVLDFYNTVNTERASRDLPLLLMDKRIEKVAKTYSEIISEEGKIDHYALSDFEFSELCNNYNIPEAKMFEILASCPDYYNPYQIFLLFMESDSHREALLLKKGQYIGAGYTIKNGKIFFIAYIMAEKE